MRRLDRSGSAWPSGKMKGEQLTDTDREGYGAMENQEINVEEIMGEIREQIRREAVMADIPSFEDIPIREEKTAATTDSTEAEREKDWPFLLSSLQYANNGCDIPYYWSFGPNSPKTFAKRVVRKLLKCLIAPILAMQNNFNAHAVRCLNQLRYFVESILAQLDNNRGELDEFRRNVAEQESAAQKRERLLKEEIAAQAKEMQEAKDEMIHLCLRIQEIEERLQQDETDGELERKIETLEQRFGELQQDIAAASGETATVKAVLAEHSARQEETGRELYRRLEILDRQSDAFSASVAKMLLKYRTNAGLQTEKSDVESADCSKTGDLGDTYTKLDYFKFQNDFRGTRSVIADRQAMYLPYFQGGTGPVLDIGCGRGEFLRILKEQNIPSFGIDMYPEYVIEGQLNGLDVRQGDGIAFLKDTDMRFGGIFAAQLIEHISFEDLQTLCFAAYEKLEPEGHIVLETPNPTCLAMFTSNFYLDPTHTKPIHPLLLAYVLREAGFREVQTIYTDASRAGKPLPLIEGEGIRNLEEVNHAIAQVSELLYGSLDYAVIAKK